MDSNIYNIKFLAKFNQKRYRKTDVLGALFEEKYYSDLKFDYADKTIDDEKLTIDQKLELVPAILA